MQEPYEKGIANHSAPSFAHRIARWVVKRKQGHGRAGYRASKPCNRDADAVVSRAHTNAYPNNLHDLKTILSPNRTTVKLRYIGCRTNPYAPCSTGTDGLKERPVKAKSHRHQR
jgi:hypothetical protein